MIVLVMVACMMIVMGGTVQRTYTWILGNVVADAFSPDGRWLLTSREDGTTRCVATGPADGGRTAARRGPPVAPARGARL